ncbi:hypothetical protein [Paenibacillus mendelii]|uniref:Uncharacterized protein n=1 Tax=Paenibacillus mendelii TaxID=206163 RepID=A0ABV6J491_9BACL|nr:hypothetical protein [Paenibacillus mendelii]MCQ6561774.1 hypothetical protein [Paenibacillus mendelii]
MANFEHWAKNSDQRMPETDFTYLAKQFGDIIDGEIKAGNSDGTDGWPQVRKTISLQHSLGKLEICEYVDRKSGTISKFEYNWSYLPDRQWKFHYDTYHPKRYWTETIHYHQHDEPTPNKYEHERIANFRMRDLLHIMETIRLIERFQKEWQIQQGQQFQSGNKHKQKKTR